MDKKKNTQDISRRINVNKKKKRKKKRKPKIDAPTGRRLRMRSWEYVTRSPRRVNYSWVVDTRVINGYPGVLSIVSHTRDRHVKSSRHASAWNVEHFAWSDEAKIASVTLSQPLHAPPCFWYYFCFYTISCDHDSPSIFDLYVAMSVGSESKVHFANQIAMMTGQLHDNRRVAWFFDKARYRAAIFKWILFRTDFIP